MSAPNRSLPPQQPWRRRLARATLLLGSLALTLASLEMGLRLISAKPKTVTVLSSFFESSPSLGWIGSPQAASRFASTEFDVAVTHDADGLRSCGLSSRIADDQREPKEVVWVLGDSGTWGWGVDDGKTYVDHLNTHAAGQTLYRNLAICGASSVQQMLVLKQRFEQGQQPDRVMVLYCNNDLYENVDQLNQDPPRPYFDVQQDEVVLRNYPVPETNGWRARTWLKKNSLAYNHLHFNLSMARKRFKAWRGSAAKPQPASQTVAEVPAAAPAEAPPKQQLIALRAAYRQMHQLCEQHGVALAIASESAGCIENLRPICDAENLTLLDLSGYWQAHLGKTDEEARFPTDPHYNELGHRLLAEAMIEQLEQVRVGERQAAGELR
jgi:lysophospholipase L1-like esterase